MKKTLLTISVLLIAGVAWWLSNADDAETTEAVVTPPEPEQSVTVDAPNVSANAAASEQEPSPLLQARQAKAAAEAELERLDAQLEEVEAYVAEIEASGLNPTDFSAEGMEKMQPILAAYLDVEVRLAAADAAIEEALLATEAEPTDED